MPETNSKEYTITERELENRHKLLYKGYCPRKKIDGNVNYCDHNILELKSRDIIKQTDKQGNKLYQSSDVISRSRSVTPVNFQYPIKKGTI